MRAPVKVLLLTSSALAVGVPVAAACSPQDYMSAEDWQALSPAQRADNSLHYGHGPETPVATQPAPASPEAAAPQAPAPAEPAPTAAPSRPVVTGPADPVSTQPVVPPSVGKPPALPSAPQPRGSEGGSSSPQRTGRAPSVTVRSRSQQVARQTPTIRADAAQPRSAQRTDRTAARRYTPASAPTSNSTPVSSTSSRASGNASANPQRARPQQRRPEPAEQTQATRPSAVAKDHSVGEAGESPASASRDVPATATRSAEPRSSSLQVFLAALVAAGALALLRRRGYGVSENRYREVPPVNPVNDGEAEAELQEMLAEHHARVAATESSPLVHEGSAAD